MASHALSRRGFLGHAAVACAALPLPVAARGGLNPLVAHFCAVSHAMGEASDLADRIPTPENEAAWSKLNDAYEDALMALLRYRPVSLAEAGERFAFLYSRQGHWHVIVPDEIEIRTIAESMMPVTA